MTVFLFSIVDVYLSLSSFLKEEDSGPVHILLYRGSYGSTDCDALCQVPKLPHQRFSTLGTQFDHILKPSYFFKKINKQTRNSR